MKRIHGKCGYLWFSVLVAGIMLATACDIADGPPIKLRDPKPQWTFSYKGKLQEKIDEAIDRAEYYENLISDNYGTSPP